MTRSGNGVEVRDTSIRLSFTDHRWVACRETLFQGTEPLSPTPPNVRYAHRVAEEIRRQLRAGTFTDETYAEFFPQSKRARGHSPSAMMNKFGGRCFCCGEWVQPRAGRFVLIAETLRLHHVGCLPSGKSPRGLPENSIA